MTQHGLETTGSPPKAGSEGLAPSGQEGELSALALRRDMGLQTHNSVGGQQVQEVRTGLGLPWAAQAPLRPWEHLSGMVPVRTATGMVPPLPHFHCRQGGAPSQLRVGLRPNYLAAFSRASFFP